MLIAKRKVSTQKFNIIIAEFCSRKVGRDNIAHAHEYYVSMIVLMGDAVKQSEFSEPMR